MNDYHDSTHMFSELPARGQQQTILFVDDDETHLKHLSEVLRMSGYGVASFHDAPAALLSIHDAVGIDLVITDFRMPGMNGLEFVEALRRLLPDVPVVMLTAQGDIDSYFKAFQLGIFEYINKPVDNGELLRIIKVALSRGISGRVPTVGGVERPLITDKEE